MIKIRIAISDYDVVDIVSIEFDVGTSQYHVRTLEVLETAIYHPVYVVGKGSTLEATMVAASQAHKTRREDLQGRPL